MSSPLTGRYELASRLDRGGDVSVHRARPLEGGGPVVVRTLPLGRGDGALVEHLRRGVGLDHERLVARRRVLVGDDVVYVVEEDVAGGGLGQRLGDALEPVDAIPAVLHVLRALEVVHGAGLVHGGVRASRVVGSSGRLRLAATTAVEESLREPAPHAADDVRGAALLTLELLEWERHEPRDADLQARLSEVRTDVSATLADVLGPALRHGAVPTATQLRADLLAVLDGLSRRHLRATSSARRLPSSIQVDRPPVETRPGWSAPVITLLLVLGVVGFLLGRALAGIAGLS